MHKAFRSLGGNSILVGVLILIVLFLSGALLISMTENRTTLQSDAANDTGVFILEDVTDPETYTAASYNSYSEIPPNIADAMLDQAIIQVDNTLKQNKQDVQYTDDVINTLNYLGQ